ncbi:hypothetical protein EMPS_07243 [Entomortierella parvispora]|uniref:IMD domain-containing protein n=1 Tax=Entomortierella parvispora TaxID=205924 RepID=A0A9P3HE56_9FUNG|nr:hypothetical protein EMPS_07243 [Entomortierella parvispora]
MLSTVSLIDPTTLNPSFSGPDTSRMGRPGVIITRADQQTAVDQFQLLLTSAKAYRLQMLALSKAAAGFGYALEKIAHSKASVRDPTNVCSSLQAAAGLHYLMSNHHQILSDTLYKQFEIPLLQHLDTHKANIEASEAQYERSMRDMSQKIKETEATSLQNGRKRQRDLLQFRQALTTLTMQVDELERIKLGYYFSNLESEQANLQLILQKTSTIVRAEVDIYERIANKGLNDTILEPMTTQGPDPYCTYPTTDEFSSIFSILPPTPIIATAGASTTTTPQPESTMSNFYGYHEVNPFSTARNQTNNPPRDRHLFGDISSVESKASMMHQAATILSKDGNAGDAATAAATSVEPTTSKESRHAAYDKATGDESEHDEQRAETAVDSLGAQESGEEHDENSQLQTVPEEATPDSPSSSTQNREEETTASQGVDLRTGENHHRRQQALDDSPQPASSTSFEQASSSVQSYSLRSRSGSRSHRMLGTTPDSPPVGASIHISKDSELLNNRDFSFSYEPRELLEQRNQHSQLNLSNHRQQRFSNGFEDMDHDSSLEDFRATTSLTSQQLSSTVTVPAHGLLHRSSHGHLSHSSSSNLSSIGSTSSGSMGSLHHRRSTGMIKSLPGESGGHLETSSSMLFGTSMEEPFLPLMKQRVEMADHIRELGRGLDDGMPAFFADDLDGGEDMSPTRSLKRQDSEGNVCLLASRLQGSNSSLDSVRMADGSSKEMSSPAAGVAVI